MKRGRKRGRKRAEETGYRARLLKSAERTLDVLELLSKKRSIGVTELSGILKVGTSTSHRILTVLEKKGFAAQDPKSGRYARGHMVFQLAHSVIHMIEPVKYVRPYLEKLRDKTGENVAFGVVTPGKDRILILAENIANKAVVARPIIFQRFPMHVCPCGKAYLLTLKDKQLKKVLSENGMTRFTEFTPTSLPVLKRQLTQFRKMGYTLSKDEFSIGLSAMASRICDAEDNFAGAIMIVGPSFRFTNENVKYWGKLLLQVTAKIGLEFKTRGVI